MMVGALNSETPMLIAPSRTFSMPGPTRQTSPIPGTTFVDKAPTIMQTASGVWDKVTDKQQSAASLLSMSGASVKPAEQCRPSIGRKRPPPPSTDRTNPNYSFELLEHIVAALDVLMDVQVGFPRDKPRPSTFTSSHVSFGHDHHSSEGGQSIGTSITEQQTSSRNHGFLDKSWPASVLVRPALATPGPSIDKERARQWMGRSLTSSPSTTRDANINSNGIKDIFGRTDSQRERRLRNTYHLLRVRDPNARVVRMYDMLAVLALVNDVLLTPYVLAWDVKQSLAISICAVLAAVYWTVFVVMKFFVGFYKNGELRMDRREVIKHYACSTFVGDLSLTTLDWLALLLPSDSTDRRLRLIKLLRVAKVIRLARVWELVEVVLEQYAPVGTRSKLVVYLIQVAALTTIFSHVMSCVWYAVGKDGATDTGVRWLELFLQASYDLGPQDAMSDDLTIGIRKSNFYKYCTCFHWTLAQLTLGSSDVYPVTSMERIFNVSLLLAGIIFNATIVSLISSQALEYIANRREQTMKMNVLKRFLEQHKVHTKLAVRVQRQVMDRISASETLLFEDDVDALKMLSTNLLDQVLLETRLPPILGHALFRVWYEADEPAITSFCQQSVKYEVFKSQDIVFVAGGEAQGMGRVVEGHLTYSQDRESSKEADDYSVDVLKGANICEAALWSKWKHVGKLECVCSIGMIGIPADGIFDLLPKHPLIAHITKQYGKAFHLRITLARPPYSGWPNDIEVPHTDPSDLLGQDIGLELLRRERMKSKTSSIIAAMTEEEYQSLLNEVEAEKCAIQAADDGSLERIVAIVAAHIVREDSRIFCQLGKFDKLKQSVSASCNLPALKRPRGELPSQTIERLVQQELAFIGRGLQMMGAETQVEVKESESLGLLTKYLRTIQYAQLQQDFEWPSDLIEVTAPDVPAPDDATSPASKKEGFKQRRRGSVQSSGHGGGGKKSFTEQSNAQDDLTGEPVLLWEKGEKVMLYSWLSLSTFSFLRSENGKPLLERWVKNIDVQNALANSGAQETESPRQELFFDLMANREEYGSNSDSDTEASKVSHI